MKMIIGVLVSVLITGFGYVWAQQDTKIDDNKTRLEELSKEKADYDTIQQMLQLQQQQFDLYREEVRDMKKDINDLWSLPSRRSQPDGQ